MKSLVFKINGEVVHTAHVVGLIVKDMEGSWKNYYLKDDERQVSIEEVSSGVLTIKEHLDEVKRLIG